jgi:ABC-type sugar transport system ATPase subunit
MAVINDGAGLTPTGVTEVLRATGLAKSYGGHLVLKHVNFSIAAGEIVAVIGENGAGKSTFAKIVAGVVHQEAGELQLRGTPVDFQSPRDALRAGIAYIPQELAYLSNRTVADNILIGRWPHKAGVTSDSTITATASSEANKFGIDLHMSWRMADLTLAEQAQRDRRDAPQSQMAADAVEIDATNLGLDDVIGRIVTMARAGRRA